MSEERTLTPAMRRWARLLERGYRIEVRRVANSHWPGEHRRAVLISPEGALVQTVRMDTAMRLMELGIVTSGELRVTSDELRVTKEDEDGDRERDDVDGLFERGAMEANDGDRERDDVDGLSERGAG